MRPLLAILLLLAAPLVAAPVPKAVKKASSPDGRWRLVEFSNNGQGESVQSMARNWQIKGETISCWLDGQSSAGGSKFGAPNPDKPNERVWGTMPAAFEVDGDTLRACYAHDGRKEMGECKPGKGVAYYVFERVKEEK